MSLKKKVVLVAVFVTLPCVVYIAASERTRANIQAAYSLYANPVVDSYAIHHEEVIFCRDRPGAVAERRITARRPDGSRVEIYNPASMRPRKSRRLEMADGVVAMIDDTVGALTSWRQYPSAFARSGSEMDPAADCMVTRDGTGETLMGLQGYDGEVLGYPVLKIVRADKGERTTIWRAPDLNCEMLKATFEYGTPLRVTSRVTATRIDLGTPSEFLFRIPDNYKEVPMSGLKFLVSKLRKEQAGKPYTGAEEEAIRQQFRKRFADEDAGYWANRP